MMKRILAVVLGFVLVFSTTVMANELTFSAVADQVEAALKEISDFRATIVIEVMQQGQLTRSVLKMAASREHQLLRLEMLEPDMVAGQIVIIDGNTQEMKMYMPIIDQIMVQSLASLTGGIEINYADMYQLINLEGLEGEIKEIKETEAGKHYLISVSNLNTQLPINLTGDISLTGNEVQNVWINHDFIPYQIETFQGNTLIAKIAFTDYEYNLGISADELNKLPNVAVIRF